MQGPPVGPVDPALHVQVVKDVPGGEFELGGHVVQALDATDPGGDLGVSALGQSVHTLAFVAPAKLENLPVQHHQGCLMVPSGIFYTQRLTLTCVTGDTHT